MPADYKSRATRKHKKSLPGYLWLLSGLAIGLFVALIVYLDKQPENTRDFGTAVQLELEKLKQQAKPDNTRQAAPAPKAEKKEAKFNFYTILPELEVLIPESETRPPESKSEKPPETSSTTHTAAKKQYVLQVGSFQNRNDAEKLKANLAFLGMAANIQHITINKQNWHRVRTGPYSDKQQLSRIKTVLKQNKIHAISMELK